MRRLNVIDLVALILVIVGGLNWAIVGIFHIDVISDVFGDMTILTRIIQILVGIAALHLFVVLEKLARQKQ